MWTPSDSWLGDVGENDNFTFTISYGVADPITGVVTDYPVTITPEEVMSGISVSGGAISGTFAGTFPQTIKYRTKAGGFVEVGSFSAIISEDLDEMVKFDAPRTHRDFYLYCTAEDGSTATYYMSAIPDWDTGKTTLQTYVNQTLGA